MREYMGTMAVGCVVKEEDDRYFFVLCLVVCVCTLMIGDRPLVIEVAGANSTVVFVFGKSRLIRKPFHYKFGRSRRSRAHPPTAAIETTQRLCITQTDGQKSRDRRAWRVARARVRTPRRFLTDAATSYTARTRRTINTSDARPDRRFKGPLTSGEGGN